MPLLDRVTMLIRANLNDLVEKAESPEKLLKQLQLDMQNQFVQVKTQTAIAIAGQHLLEKRQKESLESQKEWIKKAELALAKGQDDAARTALERSLSHEDAARNFGQQIEDQAHQVETFRDALHRLELKMIETRNKTEMLVAQHRRARLAGRAGSAALNEFERDAALDRVRGKVLEAEALGEGQAECSEPDVEKRLAALERSDKVEQMIAELKAKVRARSDRPANQ